MVSVKNPSSSTLTAMNVTHVTFRESHIATTGLAVTRSPAATTTNLAESVGFATHAISKRNASKATEQIPPSAATKSTISTVSFSAVRERPPTATPLAPDREAGKKSAAHVDAATLPRATSVSTWTKARCAFEVTRMTMTASKMPALSGSLARPANSATSMTTVTHDVTDRQGSSTTPRIQPYSIKLSGRLLTALPTSCTLAS